MRTFNYIYNLSVSEFNNQLNKETRTLNIYNNIFIVDGKMLYYDKSKNKFVDAITNTEQDYVITN